MGRGFASPLAVDAMSRVSFRCRPEKLPMSVANAIEDKGVYWDRDELSAGGLIEKGHRRLGIGTTLKTDSAPYVTEPSRRR